MEDSFNYMNLDVKVDFVLNQGEFISEIEDSEQIMQLYAIGGFYAEIIFGLKKDDFEDVRLIHPADSRLGLYAQKVDISSAL